MKKIAVFLCALSGSSFLFGMDSAEEMKELNSLGITFEFLDADDRDWECKEANQNDKHVNSPKSEAEISSQTIETKEAKVQDPCHENQMPEPEIGDELPHCPENVNPIEFYAAVFQTIMRDADKMAGGQSVRYNPGALERLSDHQLDGLKSKFEALNKKIKFLSEPAEKSNEAKISGPSPLACLKDDIATMIEFVKDTYSYLKSNEKYSGEKVRKKFLARQKRLINERALIIKAMKDANPESPLYWDLQYRLFVVNAEMLERGGNFRFTGDPMVDLSSHFLLMNSMSFEYLIKLRNDCNNLAEKINGFYHGACKSGDHASAKAFYEIFVKIKNLLTDISNFVARRAKDLRREQRKQEAEEKARQVELATQQDLQHQHEAELKRQSEDEYKKQEDQEKADLTDEEARQELELQQHYQIFLQQQQHQAYEQHLAAQRPYCYAMPQQQHNSISAAPYQNANIIVPRPMRPVAFFNQGMMPNVGGYRILPFNGVLLNSFVLPLPQ